VRLKGNKPRLARIERNSYVCQGLLQANLFACKRFSTLKTENPALNYKKSYREIQEGTIRNVTDWNEHD
jgi:hypothetical protein